METQTSTEAANIIIAELNKKIDEQKNKIEALQKLLNDSREEFKKERLQHAYLSEMYQDLLDKIIK